MAQEETAEDLFRQFSRNLDREVASIKIALMDDRNRMEGTEPAYTRSEIKEMEARIRTLEAIESCLPAR